MKYFKNQKRVNKPENIEQFYVIKIEGTNGSIEHLDFAFKNYSEARKTALYTIRKKNNLNLTRQYLLPDTDACVLFHEVSPDFWKNKNETISIQVIKIKDLSLKNTLLPKVKTADIKALEYIEEEIKL
jgi:hypothetical protein